MANGQITFSIYVVDDEEFIRDAAVLNLTDYRVRAFADGEAAIKAVEGAPPDLVLLDVGLPGLTGLEVLSRLKPRHPEVLFIMITAYEDIETVIRAMRLGAHDYLVKPLQMDTLKLAIQNALETVRLRKEVRALQEQCLRDNLPVFVAESHLIQDVMDYVAKVAASPDAPVLVVGDTGTGKELIAAAIHHQSPNFRGPLLTINCAAIPAELLESELFGYEPGAFSGARGGGKKGLVEEAAGGTLFLDEVGELSPEAQAKLLRFLDHGEFYKVGGTRPQKVQTRVVSATNRDLLALAEAGKFRRDLYYRLAVLKVEVPNLAQRKEDILPIARHFLGELGQKYGKNFTDLEPEAQRLLVAREWQGNVRELKAVMERGALTGTGPVLTAAALGLAPAGPGAGAAGGAGGAAGALPPEGVDLAAVLEQTERDYFVQALAQAGGNESQAARLLGLNYHTFRYRRKKLLGEEN